METISFDGAETPDEGGVARQTLSRVLGTTEMAVNHYRISPGEGLPGGLHAHPDQEELFVVLAGKATFETCVPARDGAVTGKTGETVVEAGAAVRFAPGEFQSGRNGGDDELEVLALGAPRDTEDVRVPVACPECGHSNLRLDTGDELRFVCPGCGVERVPRPCPDCAHQSLEMALGEERGVVAVCRNCGSTFETPPFGK